MNVLVMLDNLHVVRYSVSLSVPDIIDLAWQCILLCRYEPCYLVYYDKLPFSGSQYTIISL